MKRLPRQERECPHCGSKFIPGKYQAQKYCTRECSIAARGSKESPLKGIPRPELRKRRLAFCKRCGRPFEATKEWHSYTRDYCSRECAKPRLTPIMCQQCSVDFTPRNSKQKFCCKQCADNAARVRQAGENSHFWLGGKTKASKLLRTSASFRQWRKAVFERDSYTCVECGDKCGPGNKVELHPDHIKPLSERPDLAFEISNGRTLCKPCHEKTETYGYKQRWKRAA